jgi:hypothetical protein
VNKLKSEYQITNFVLYRPIFSGILLLRIIHLLELRENHVS